MTVETTHPAPPTTVHNPDLADALARAQVLLAEVETATDHSALAIGKRCGELTAELRQLISAVNGDAAVRALRDAR